MRDPKIRQIPVRINDIRYEEGPQDQRKEKPCREISYW